MINVRDIIIGEGMPKIIVPLVGHSDKVLVEEVNSILELKPDIVEWRIDSYDEVENLEAVRDMLSYLRERLAEIPLLFTYRSAKEGGKKEAPVEFYFELTRMAIQSKLIDLVDIELYIGHHYVKELVSLAKANGIYVILSNHSFRQTPEKEAIVSRLQNMFELGADIPKIAVMPTNAQDVLTLLDATYLIKSKYPDRPIITVSMGKIGFISRLLGETFGSAATFASGKEKSAPGQINVQEIRNILNIIHKTLMD